MVEHRVHISGGGGSKPLLTTINNIMNNKQITKEQLLAVLPNIPDNSLISTNDVGNLCIANSDNIYIGYVDFLLDGEYCPQAD